MAERRKKVRTRLSWADVDPKVVLAVADLCDGHTIFPPMAFTEIGAPPAIVAQHLHHYQSDTADPKSVIHGPSGGEVEGMVGVYGLRVLQTICNDCGIKYESKLGRGFQAKVCSDAIKRHFAATEVADG